MEQQKIAYVKFKNGTRKPVEDLADKIGKLRGGPLALAAPLPAAVLEAVEDYTKKIDRQLRDKGIEV